MKPKTTNNLKYAVMWRDENALVSPFYDTPEEAKAAFVKDTGEPWDEDSYEVEPFTPERVVQSESWPEI